MDNVGEQIREARNAKGWTQAALAEKMHVSRSAVANWEQGQRLPDMATLVKLMNVLDCQLGGFSVKEMDMEEPKDDVATMMYSEETISVSDRAENLNSDDAQVVLEQVANQTHDVGVPKVNQESNTTDTSETTESKTESDQFTDSIASDLKDSTSVCFALDSVKKASAISRVVHKRIILILVAALVAVAFLVYLVILPALQPKSKGIPYTSVDGEVYTIERMQQQVENNPGKAYLIVNPSVQINHGESADYYLFEFKYHEMNGIALSIDRLELVYFSKLKENAFFINTAEDIKQQYGMTVDIPAHGDWSYVSGLPVQDTAYGVGVLLHCTDENAQKLSFTSYISFPEL